MTSGKRQTGRKTAKEYERRHLYVVDGSAARELAPATFPKAGEGPSPKEQKEQEKRSSRRVRERALTISPTYVMLLAFVSVLMLGVCVHYLQARVSIYTQMGNVEALEQELSGLQNANEAVQSRIEAASDIKRIYRIATEELGMVYPEDSQIIRYDRTESEYVQQYERIPEE